MPRGRPRKGASAPAREAKVYEHKEAKVLLRPDVGTQAQFKKRKPPQRYRYDDSMSPAMEWDAKNPSRDQGEGLLKELLDAKTLEQAKAAAVKLKAMTKPFLNWAGKAERTSFEVPTLPLFVHERLSTQAIIETLKGHKREKTKQLSLLDLFGDPQRPVADQVLRAYEYKDDWVNRMVLGDSLVVMNSLLHYEGLGGQVQMIYMDPPYGVSFGSNFQPFVRRRDVVHGSDEDMTREPEAVQAYRDTWELGLHSYLTYLRDRLLLARELLSSTGSIFVQIGDGNLHHVREIMDEVFGRDCFVVTIPIKKKGSQKSGLMDPVNDYLVWYSREPRESGRVAFQPIFVKRPLDSETLSEFKFVELPDGTEHSVAEVPDSKGRPTDYRLNPEKLFHDHPKARLFRSNPMTSGGVRKNQSLPFKFKGKTYHPGDGACWKTPVRTDDGSKPGMETLAEAGRLIAGEGQLRFKSYLDDFGFVGLTNWWDGLGGAASPVYVVQTNVEIVQRCILMTTRPGDLVLDPTCGSGSTAYVAEQWGRRWITIDTSRVPLALARQRILTATFPWYELGEESRGPVGGFQYRVKGESRNPKSVGPGIVEHATLGSIANHEPPEQEVLVDRPETNSGVTRVSGPFVVEATIPTPVDWEGDGVEDSGVSSVRESYGTFVERMLEVLRRSPTLHVGKGKSVQFRNVRQPARTLSLSAEATVANGQDKPVALVFGPESGAVSEKLVFEAAKEAQGKSYKHLYVIGFAIQPNARKLVEDCEAAMGIPATYAQATPDLMMSDLLKTMRSSQIFSVCGLPDVRLRKVKGGNGQQRYEVELVGLDVFDPASMETTPQKGNDVPAWFLDTDYNGLCFHVTQAFFPLTAAWDGLSKALKATHAESVWEHLAGTTSAAFEEGDHGQVAIKVIDHRGNELLVVKGLKEAE